jgi:hypothetical protein
MPATRLPRYPSVRHPLPTTYQEEEPVTFQVALQASDGWIMASDTLETRDGGASSYPSIRHRTHTNKITYDANAGIAYFVCGDALAMNVAREAAPLFAGSAASLETRLVEVANQHWSKDHRKEKSPSFRRVVFKRTTSDPPFDGPFWELTIDKRSELKALSGKLVSGDIVSPAVFFTERYYDQKYPVRKLLRLAAHTILIAATFNKSIGGLELLFREKSRGQPVFWKLGAPELEQFEDFSSNLEKQIRGSLFNLNRKDNRT